MNKNTHLDPINIIDLVMQLWHEKKFISVNILITLFLASVYICFIKEKWTAYTIITQPNAEHIFSYKNALNVIYGNEAPSVTSIQSMIIERILYAFTALSNKLENQKKPEKLVIKAVFKEQPFPVKITYQSETPELAKNNLTKYIQKIEESIKKELICDLQDSIKQKIMCLNNALENQEKIAQEKKNLHIKKISEALKIAIAANITSPYIRQTRNFDQDSIFLFGSAALSSMVKHASTRPLLYSSLYYDLKQAIFDIKKLSIDPSSIRVFHYVMRPDLPMYRDNPKLFLTLSLAGFLGGIISSCYILSKNSILDYQKNKFENSWKKSKN